MIQILSLVLLTGLISSQCTQNDPFCAQCVNNQCRLCYGGFLQSTNMCAAPTVIID